MFKNIFLLYLIVGILFFSCSPLPPIKTKKTDLSKEVEETKNYAIVLHGGAGTILKENMTDEKEKEYLAILNKALNRGEDILKNGGTSMDAVEATILIMEDSPLFNSAKGAVFTNDGKNELDASFMDGKTQNAGAVGGVTNVKNPIKLARAVMEQSDHVMLVREGAEAFAKKVGLEIVDPSYFYTERRWESLQRAKAKEAGMGEVAEESEDYKFGTVGCAALDQNGDLAAGTSTGGMTNKRWNRIGDSPIIGAGTYANNNTCAISSTGHGEYFIRYAVAYDISAMMEYGGVSFQKAADEVINNKLKRNGGSGGIVGVDKEGNIAMPFNTKGMYRAYAKPGERVVKIYEE